MIKAKATGARSAWRNCIGAEGYMGISLHSNNHTGSRLLAMVRWANEEGKFSRVRIGLSDTLNAYNYMADEGLSYEDACAKARALGDQWLLDNSDMLSQLDMPYEVVRWDHWKKNYNDEIETYKSQFYSSLSTDTLFREALTKDVSAYFSRHAGTPIDQVSPDKVAMSIAYLIEELAVYSVIFKDRPAMAIYPGKQLHCFGIIRDGHVGHFPTYIVNSRFTRLALHETSPALAPPVFIPERQGQISTP